VVDFARHQCLASREYRTGTPPLYLAFKPAPSGDVMQISLVLLRRASTIAVEEPVEIRFDDGAPIKTSLLAFGSKDIDRQVLRINLPLASFAAAPRAARLSIKAPRIIDEQLQLSSMPVLMKQIDACLADLRTYWNVEGGTLASKAQPVKPLAQYFDAELYPEISVRGEQSGDVRFVLLIDEAGNVADCMVTATSSVPALDAQTCIAATKVKFKPALGPDCKAARDSIFSRIRWVLP
jgi:TonB family protein